MAKKELKRKIKRISYRALDGNFTQIANTMFRYIPSGNDFKVYCYLCYRFNRDMDYAFPSLKTISKDTGLGLSTVKRSIKWLEEQRFIKKYKKEGSDWMNNCYFVKYIVEELVEVDEIDEEIITEEWEEIRADDDDEEWEVVEIISVEEDDGVR